MTLREELVIHRVEGLAGGVDRERQRDAKQFPEDRLHDYAGVTLKNRALDSIDLDGSGGFQQGRALGAVIGGDHMGILGHRDSRQIRAKILFLAPIVLFCRLCKMQEFAADTATGQREGETTMARTIKNPVVATISKRDGETLFIELLRSDASSQYLADMVGYDIDDQCGPCVVLEMTRRDAEKIQQSLDASIAAERIDRKAFKRLSGAIGFATAAAR